MKSRSSLLLVGTCLAALGCSHAAHVRDGVGCVDERSLVVLQVPASEDGTAAATWAIQLSSPLQPGQAIRIIRSAESAEYREGSPQPSFVSQHVDGVLKRLDDDPSGAQHYAIQAVAKDASIDTNHVGKRGLVGKFSARPASSCRS